LRRWFLRVALNVCEFRATQFRMLVRHTIEDEPEHEPQQAECAREDKGPLPTVVEIEPRHAERRDDRADVRASVEDAGGERALTLRKPFGDCLDGGREITGLTETEQ